MVTFVSVSCTLTGCAAKIDRITVDRIVDRASDVGDTAKVCAMGEALVHPLASFSGNEPDKALTIAEGVAALCAEQAAWEAELDGARVKRNGLSLGEARAAEITDARIRAERAHAEAANRFERSFQHAQAAFGTIGADGAECPHVRERDEFVYLFGLVTGTLALLHDRNAAGANGVPLDRLAAIARGSSCLDDATWWGTPSALRASAWATIPGTGPADVDPWVLFETAAQVGDPSGVRVARAMQTLIAANSGRVDVLEPAIRGYAAAVAATPRSTEWALLDAYANDVIRHQSDLLWVAAAGHRTEQPGALPSDAAPPPVPPGPDLFGGGDPFGAPPIEPAAPPVPEPVQESP